MTVGMLIELMHYQHLQKDLKLWLNWSVVTISYVLEKSSKYTMFMSSGQPVSPLNKAELFF